MGKAGCHPGKTWFPIGMALDVAKEELRPGVRGVHGGAPGAAGRAHAAAWRRAVAGGFWLRKIYQNTP